MKNLNIHVAALTSDMTTEGAYRALATLTRRLLVLNDRVAHMALWLAHHSDNKNADLSYEQVYAQATADIAAEFCADFEQAGEPACAAQGLGGDSVGSRLSYPSI